MAITTNRDVHIQAHTTPDVSSALRKEAKKHGVSQSRLIHQILVISLQKVGHDVTGYEYRITDRGDEE